MATPRTSELGNAAVLHDFVNIYLVFSNCQGSLILDIMRYARIKPQVLQVELHPYLTQDALVRLAKELGLAITAYSSFGPASYIELAMDRGAPSLLTHNVIASLASGYKKSRSSLFVQACILRNWESSGAGPAALGYAAWYRGRP
jgi:diketogulonate reductase-like aldo/keto reductase